MKSHTSKILSRVELFLVPALLAVASSTVVVLALAHLRVA